MDSYTIHHTPTGLRLEADNRSVLIGEKDLPLLRIGMTRPLRDESHEPLGRGYNAGVIGGSLVIQLGKDQIIIPARVWMDRSGIRRVILSSSVGAVTA
jgi:hypothetical protein